MAERKSLRKTRFVCVSDTHNTVPNLPKGDVLIHAGDLTNQGTYSELRKAVKWLEGSDFEEKIVIAGIIMANTEYPMLTLVNKFKGITISP